MSLARALRAIAALTVSASLLAGTTSVAVAKPVASLSKAAQEAAAAKAKLEKEVARLKQLAEVERKFDEAAANVDVLKRAWEKLKKQPKPKVKGKDVNGVAKAHAAKIKEAQSRYNFAKRNLEILRKQAKNCCGLKL